ncbi:unnamed protein product [Calypogeia fissa]
MPRELRSMVMVEQLLARPPDSAMRNYYDKLSASGRGPGVRVEQIGGALGKGLFADRDFKEDELVLREPKLVGAQHTANKADALVCSFCFQYIGSLELQIGRRLLPGGDECLPDASQHHDHSHNSTSRTERSGQNSRGLEELAMDIDECSRHESNDGEEGCGCEDMPSGKKPVSAKLVNALLNGDISLPESDLFPLPPMVNCLGGCSEELFCSKACADEAWNSYHSLLCRGPGSLCQDQKALARFKEFADDTNDIFHVAAQVISGTILQAQRLKNEKGEHQIGRKLTDLEQEQEDFDILLRAWEPFAMGHKKLWWEAVALPNGMTLSEEPAFREEIKGLAFKSLKYLKEAIYEEAFSPLFSLEVYGHIIGMFEQNNLEIVVASPVEDYFIYIDDLPPLAKAEADLIVEPFLEALGSDYAAYCQGSGFFVLQSCINHSCQPNAKAFKRDEDRDGHAVVLATRPIRKGEEITISYIDEDADLEDRQAMLADYGFVCACPRCGEESSQS